MGKAKEAADIGGIFSNMTENALKILKYVNAMEMYELTDALSAFIRGERQI